MALQKITIEFFKDGVAVDIKTGCGKESSTKTLKWQNKNGHPPIEEITKKINKIVNLHELVKYADY